jgi:hypothetical protein
MRAFKLATVLLLSLALAGCLGAGSSTLHIDPKLVEAIPRVNNSHSSPCWQQQEIAAQTSWIESAKTGKEVVYVAPCKDKPQTPPVSRVEPKLS